VWQELSWTQTSSDIGHTPRFQEKTFEKLEGHLLQQQMSTERLSSRHSAQPQLDESTNTLWQPSSLALSSFHPAQCTSSKRQGHWNWWVHPESGKTSKTNQRKTGMNATNCLADPSSDVGDSTILEGRTGANDGGIAVAPHEVDQPEAKFGPMQTSPLCQSS